MATATAEPTSPANNNAAPAQAASPAVTRPADEIEDPYVWKPAGAFGLQVVQPKPPVPEPSRSPAPPPMIKAHAAYEALWRWRDFFAGFAVGAMTVAAVSMAYRMERR